MTNISKKILLCSAVVMTASSAWAVDKTETMNVSLTVASECTLAANPLTFSGYNTVANSDASAALTVTCTKGTSYKVYLEASNSGVRKLENGAETLNYSLFSDTGRLNTFPETAGTATPATAGATAATVTVYGRVPSGQDAAVGTYADVVTVTLAY